MFSKKMIILLVICSDRQNVGYWKKCFVDKCVSQNSRKESLVKTDMCRSLGFKKKSTLDYLHSFISSI